MTPTVEGADPVAGLWAWLTGGGRRVISYRAPQTRLTPHRVVKADDFSFGVPWPWEEVPASTVMDVDAPPLVAVAAPRTDGKVPLFHVTRRGPWVGAAGTNLDEMLWAFADAKGARALQIRRVSLAGIPAEVLCVARGERQLLQLLVRRQGLLIEGFLDAPSPGYLHHFELMLATWRWVT